MSNDNIYDLLIIGAGCAGASAGMYASRLNLKTAMIAEMPGGLITSTHLVENWPGIKSISGTDLAMSLLDHATSFGAELINENVTDVLLANLNAPVDKKSGYIVKTKNKEYKAKSVLFATGTKHKKLGLQKESYFENKGLSYCALCDGAFYKNKTVCVVGGGDSSAKEALFLSDIAEKVYMIVRKDVLRAEAINFDRISNTNNIEILFNSEITDIIGDERVEKIVINNDKELLMDAIFVAIGHDALSLIAEKLGVNLNDKREIIINRKSETNLSGIYGAGDVVDTEFKQAITGSAEAVTSAYFASLYINNNDIVF